LGERCDDRPCDDGLACASVPDSGARCVELQPEGAECYGGDCEEGFFCSVPEGRCAPVLGVDEVCTDVDQCGAGLECTDDGRCRPEPPAASEGEPCDLARRCREGLDCRPQSSPGVCRPRFCAY